MVRGELLIGDRKGLDRHCFERAVRIDPDWLTHLEIALIYRFSGHPSKAAGWARLLPARTLTLIFIGNHLLPFESRLQ